MLPAVVVLLPLAPDPRTLRACRAQGCRAVAVQEEQRAVGRAAGLRAVAGAVTHGHVHVDSVFFDGVLGRDCRVHTPESERHEAYDVLSYRGPVRGVGVPEVLSASWALCLDVWSDQHDFFLCVEVADCGGLAVPRARDCAAGGVSDGVMPAGWREIGWLFCINIGAGLER